MGPISDEKLEKIKPWLKLFLVIFIVIIIVFYIIGEKFMFKNRKGFWSIEACPSKTILPVDEDTKSIISDTLGASFSQRRALLDESARGDTLGDTMKSMSTKASEHKID